MAKRELETRVPFTRLGSLELEARKFLGTVPEAESADLDPTELEARDLSGEFNRATELNTRAPNEVKDQLKSHASKNKATKVKLKKKTPTKNKTTKAKKSAKPTSKPA